VEVELAVERVMQCGNQTRRLTVFYISHSIVRAVSAALFNDASYHMCRPLESFDVERATLSYSFYKQTIRTRAEERRLKGAAPRTRARARKHIIAARVHTHTHA
jgi:hypothetical protein